MVDWTIIAVAWEWHIVCTKMNEGFFGDTEKYGSIGCVLSTETSRRFQHTSTDTLLSIDKFPRSFAGQ